MAFIQLFILTLLPPGQQTTPHVPVRQSSSTTSFESSLVAFMRFQATVYNPGIKLLT